MIRNPKTLGRVGPPALGAVHALAGARPASCRRKIWPDYTFGCKRVLFSSLFLPALARENVELVDEPITAVTPTRRRHRRRARARGRLHHLGHRLPDQRLHVPDARSRARAGATLDATSGQGGAHAHLGISVPGFPSMFVMYGPNTNTSGGSIIFYLEAQAGYIRRALQQVRARGAAAIDGAARRSRRRSDRAMQARFAGTAWTAVRLLVPKRRRADRRQLARLHARVRRGDRERRSADYEFIG